MYFTLPISKSAMLIANDVPEVLGRVNEHENRSKILVNSESKEESDRLFNGLSVGGEVEASMGDIGAHMRVCLEINRVLSG